MGDYAAINVRLKVKKDAPDFVRQFLDTWFFKTDPVQAVHDLERVEQTTVLNTLKHYPGGVGDLASMIAQCSVYHKHWCWRVAEDKDGYTLYESKASCNHRSVDEDLLVLVATGLLPWLSVGDGEVVARVIHEQASQERVVVCDPSVGYARMENGYLHKWSDDVAPGDGTHPREETRYYPEVLADIEGNDRFTRLVPENSEFYPPWNTTEIDVLNVKNAGKWAEERAENRGFGF